MLKYCACVCVSRFGSTIHTQNGGRVEGITITFVLRGIMKEVSRGKVLFLRDEITIEFEVVIEEQVNFHGNILAKCKNFVCPHYVSFLLLFMRAI